MCCSVAQKRSWSRQPNPSLQVQVALKPRVMLSPLAARFAGSGGVATAAWNEHDALDSPDGDLMLDVAELDDLSAVLLMAVVVSVVPHLDEPRPLMNVLLSAATTFAAKLLAVGLFGKIAGTALPALLATSRRGALLLGVSMVPRAEIALVVAYQGITLGVLSEATYSAIVFVSAASCTLAPWLISGLLRERPGAR